MKKSEFKKEAVLYGLATFMVPALMFVIVCAVLRITPFGDKTFLYEDMKQQYVDFFAYYKAVFHGQDGFLTSENCGLGSNMLGIWTYYLTSPFLLPFIWIPEKMLPVAVTVLIGTKLSAAGLTMGCFLRSVTDRKDTVIVFSTAYAFSAWLVANMTNTMWIDGAIMLPIMAYTYRKLLRREKNSMLLYVLSVAVAIYVNYYIAAMMLIFLLVFSLLGLALRELDLKACWRFGLGSILSVIADLWVLIPVVCSLRGSNKDHTGDVARAFSSYLPSSEAVARNISPVDVISKLFCISYDSIEIMEGFPNIYFGTVLVLPMLLFFLNKKINKKHRIMAFIYLAVLMAFFCISELDKLAHGETRAYGYLYRYSFVFSFVCLIMGCVCLSKIEGLTVKNVVFGGVFEEFLLAIAYLSRVRFLSAKMLLINTALVMVATVLMAAGVYATRKTQSNIVSVGNDPEKGTGGADTENGAGSSLLRMVRWAAILVLAAELMLNFLWIYRSQAMNATYVSEYSQKVASIETALDSIYNSAGEEGREGDRFRIENYNRRTPNDGLHFGYRNVSTYNSLLKVEDRELLYRMGFNDNGLYAEYGPGNTRTADALLGIRYLITDEEYVPLEGQKKVAGDVIENEVALDHETYIKGEDTKELLSYIDTKDGVTDSPFDVQEALWEKLTGNSDEIFVNAEVSVIDKEHRDNGDDQDALNYGDDIFEEIADHIIFYKAVAKSDGEMYFYMNKQSGVERNLTVYIDGEFAGGYGNASSQKVLHVGYFHVGESVEIGILPDEINELPSEPMIVTERFDFLK